MSQTQIQINDYSVHELLRGHLKLPHESESGLVILLRGKAGTGKSTFAIQLLDILQPASTSEKLYVTLEQTADDLKFKRAQMRVQKAIHQSRCQEEVSIKCRQDEYYKSLGISNPSTPDVHLETLEWPVEGEQSQTQRQAFDQAIPKLTDALIQNASFASQIKVFGTEKPEGSEFTELPLGHPESRILDAVKKLERHLVPEGSNVPQNRDQRPIIVIDGLSLFSASEREILHLQTIVQKLRTAAQVGILVYEPNQDESVSLDHHADMVVGLTSRDLEQSYLIHELTIEKSRYQEAALGSHQFKIRASGLAIFPSVHFQVHHYNYMDLELLRTTHQTPHRQTEAQPKPDSQETKTTENSGETTRPILTELSSLIDVIFNPGPGESTVLLGHRGAFKTELCLDFVGRGYWGCPKGNPSPAKALLISLIDNTSNTRRIQKCPWAGGGLPGQCKDCSQMLDHVTAFCQRPGCITPAEFLHYVNRCIKPNPEQPKPLVDRVLFWDLTQMDFRFPLFKRDPMLLPALLDTFKSNYLTSLFMGAGNAENTKAASAMADNVLFCWRSIGKPASSDTATPFKTPSTAELQESDQNPSLLLYVDRTSTEIVKYGKCLYRIPIKKSGKLEIPTSNAALQQPPYQLTPDEYRIHLSKEDLEQIQHINNMQGVA